MPGSAAVTSRSSGARDKSIRAGTAACSAAIALPGSPAVTSRVISVTGRLARRHTTWTGSGSSCQATDVRSTSWRAMTCCRAAVNSPNRSRDSIPSTSDCR